MIEEFKFGFFRINGREYYDDIKIIDNQIRHWTDRIGHQLQEKHLAEILQANPQLVVIGIGASGLLEVSAGIKQMLAAKRIRLLVDKTTYAVQAYNKALQEGVRVAALLHATC